MDKKELLALLDKYRKLMFYMTDDREYHDAFLDILEELTERVDNGK